MRGALVFALVLFTALGAEAQASETASESGGDRDSRTSTSGEDARGDDARGEDVVASFEYAVSVLHTPLLMVLNEAHLGADAVTPPGAQAVQSLADAVPRQAG